MAYNAGFPATYQPVYYQPSYQPQMPQQPVQQNNGGIIWVSGEAGAKAYLVAPNTTVQLWDSEAQTIYLKSADASGMPTMKILDYTIRSQVASNAPTGASASRVIDNTTYATKTDLEALRGQIEAFRAELDSLSVKRGTKKEVSANE